MPTNPNQPNQNDPNKDKQPGDQRQPQNQPGVKKEGDIGKEPMKQPNQPGGNPDERERKGQGI